MRFPRLNSDFVSSKSEAFAIAYPKKKHFQHWSPPLFWRCAVLRRLPALWQFPLRPGTYMTNQDSLVTSVCPLMDRKIFRKSDLKEMKAKTLTSVLSLKETSTSFSYPTEITPTNLR